jgi:hypothetical protein
MSSVLHAQLVQFSIKMGITLSRQQGIVLELLKHLQREVL